MPFWKEGKRVNSCDQVVIQRQCLNLVWDWFGIDGLELVEWNIHSVDIKLILLVKIVSYIFNLVLVDIQPVEWRWQEEVVKLLDLVVRYVQPAKSWEVIEKPTNIGGMCAVPDELLMDRSKLRSTLEKRTFDELIEMNKNYFHAFVPRQHIYNRSKEGIINSIIFTWSK